MLTKQELLADFCSLFDLDILEWKSLGCYGLTAVVVEANDYMHDFCISIQYSGESNTTFAISATKQTEAMLKASGMPYQDAKVNLGKFLVSI